MLLSITKDKMWLSDVIYGLDVSSSARFWRPLFIILDGVSDWSLCPCAPSLRCLGWFQHLPAMTRCWGLLMWHPRSQLQHLTQSPSLAGITATVPPEWSLKKQCLFVLLYPSRLDGVIDSSRTLSKVTLQGLHTEPLLKRFNEICLYRPEGIRRIKQCPKSAACLEVKVITYNSFIIVLLSPGCVFSEMKSAGLRSQHISQPLEKSSNVVI